MKRTATRLASAAIASLATIIIGSASPASAPPSSGAFNPAARLDVSQVAAQRTLIWEGSWWDLLTGDDAGDGPQRRNAQVEYALNHHGEFNWPRHKRIVLAGGDR